MPEIAADEPPSLTDLTGYHVAGRAWVGTDGGDHPVAYLIADVVDGNTHIEQVSVHPEHARRGIGWSLIERLAGWSLEQGRPALTLTTFIEVPWNAPYYRRHGFRLLPESEWTPGLRRIRAREAAHGLDRWPRCTMGRTFEIGL
jgi:GNAT superfamily N-acetyltransferase